MNKGIDTIEGKGVVCLWESLSLSVEGLKMVGRTTLSSMVDQCLCRRRNACFWHFWMIMVALEASPWGPPCVLTLLLPDIHPILLHLLFAL